MSTHDRPNGFITRREALGLLGAASLAGKSAMGATDVSCVLIARETQGPYPLFKNIAHAGQFVRQNITEGRSGVPLNLLLNIRNVSKGCAPLADAKVYVWHCDKDGVYSGYRQPGGANSVGETFCRGVQPTDADGQARFVTIYPGWYPGRITHIHFRVYVGDKLEATSQLAFPEDVTKAVYTTSLYAGRGQNATVSGFDDDSIFSDGVRYQLCSTSRNAASGGYDASLNVGVAL